ncbi:MAG: TetR/AcrR family transcriptional regulator [Pseudomonadota bacterium]
MSQKPAGEPRTVTEARIIEAAKTLFAEKGFSPVSTDLLCREARVSKTSIYKYFENMQGVLAAVVRDEGEIFDLYRKPVIETREDAARALADYGVRLLTLLNSRFCRQLDRMMHEESRGNPDVARTFFDRAYGQSRADVAAMISTAVEKGVLDRVEDPVQTAEDLISLWEGFSLIEARLGLVDLPYPRPEPHVERCLGIVFPGLIGLGDRAKSSPAG